MPERISVDKSKARSPTGGAERIVDFFDRRAADYDREYSSDTTAGYALRMRRKRVLELFDQPGGTVLDVGCGPAVMTEDLLARRCRFYGVDPSEQTIAIARGRFGAQSDAHFLMGDAERLPFADAFFDAVLCMGVIDSVLDAPRAIQELMRVLKPRGTLIITSVNMFSPYAWWKNFVYYPIVRVWHRMRLLRGDPISVKGIRSTLQRRLYSRGSTEMLVASNGARVTDVVPCHFNVFLSPLDELMPGTALRVTRTMEEGALRWPRWLAAVWILKAKKL